MLLYREIGSLWCYQIKMRQYWNKADFFQIWLVSSKRRDRDPREETPCDDGSRGGGVVAVNQGPQRLQVNKHKPRRSKEGFTLSDFRGSMEHPSYLSWAFSFQNGDRINLVVLSPPVCDILIQQLRNKYKYLVQIGRKIKICWGNDKNCEKKGESNSSFLITAVIYTWKLNTLT